MFEIETKILEVDKQAVKAKLLQLGAEEILNTKLTVDWYGPTGLTHNGDDPWYLRVRKSETGNTVVTWKSLAKHVGSTRQSEEVSFTVSDGGAVKKLFEVLGLQHYAHQEKFRISFRLNEWRLDLDEYPAMPAYLEIEGSSLAHVQEAIEILGLTQHKAVSEGERKLIQEVYKLNWNDMRFS